MTYNQYHIRLDGLRFNGSFTGKDMRCSVCMMLVPNNQLDSHKCDDWWTEEASIKFIRDLFGETDIDFVVLVNVDPILPVTSYTAFLPMDIDENKQPKPDTKLFGAGETYEDALTDICMKLIRLMIRSFFDKRKIEIDELFEGELI